MLAEISAIYGLLFLSAYPQTASQPATGSLQGGIFTESGHGITRATVVVQLIPFTFAGKPDSITLRARTTVGGQFRFDALPPGKYSVCVEPDDGRYLNPCLWDFAPPTVIVHSGQRTVWSPPVIKEGIFAAVEFDDAEGHLNRFHTGPNDGLVVAIRTRSGELLPATLSVKAQSRRVYIVPMPVGEFHYVHVISSKVLVSQAKRPELVDRPIPVHASRGSQSFKLNVKVLGAKLAK